LAWAYHRAVAASKRSVSSGIDELVQRRQLGRRIAGDREAKAIGFQHHHVAARPSQRESNRETGDTATDHRHIGANIADNGGGRGGLRPRSESQGDVTSECRYPVAQASKQKPPTERQAVARVIASLPSAASACPRRLGSHVAAHHLQ
jgi:hypothetical protein